MIALRIYSGKNSTFKKWGSTVKGLANYFLFCCSEAKPSRLQYVLDAEKPPEASNRSTTPRNESVTVDVIGSEVKYSFYVSIQHSFSFIVVSRRWKGKWNSNHLVTSVGPLLSMRCKEIHASRLFS